MSSSSVAPVMTISSAATGSARLKINYDDEKFDHNDFASGDWDHDAVSSASSSICRATPATPFESPTFRATPLMTSALVYDGADYLSP